MEQWFHDDLPERAERERGVVGRSIERCGEERMPATGIYLPHQGQ